MSPAALNQSLFLWLNNACAALPDWWWASLTIAGHTSVLFALCAPLLLKHRQLVTALFVSAPLGGLLSTVVKELLQVPRPPAVLAAEQFHLIGHKLELVSFPSGHTLAAFTVATLLTLGLGLGGWRWVCSILLASLVGLSRIAVGAHWPLDVLGGAVFGTACGWMSWRVAIWLHRAAWTRSVIYVSCQSVILGLVSLGLFATSMGYPQALGWQYTAALFGAAFAVYSILLLLKSAKS